MVDPYDTMTVATRYSGATIARSSTMSTMRMPRTVRMPTFWKSAPRTSWTSVNCAMGPPMYISARGPKDGAAPAMTTRAWRMTSNAPPLYGLLAEVR